MIVNQTFKKKSRKIKNGFYYHKGIARLIIKNNLLVNEWPRFDITSGRRKGKNIQMADKILNTKEQITYRRSNSNK